MFRLATVVALVASFAVCGHSFAWAQEKPLNVMLITADDLNYDSLGITGSQTKDVSPNLDQLATQGMLLTRAHVNIAVCQPCRECLMTGRLPHNNGGMGFQPIRRTVPTLGEQLREAGYFQGIMAKVKHLAPQDKYCWDFVVMPNQLGSGRSPGLYRKHATEFFAQVKKSGKPFFLMANTQDPHRPFARRVRDQYQPEDVQVPGFLPDLPDVRLEISEYYTSVRRCDQVVGELLATLKESGYEDDTLVMFLSDHGMALPFAKTNCYRHSTHTPLIVRWPGKVEPNTTDDEHFVSTIDLLPTILEATRLPALEGVDGRSFLTVLQGQTQKDRQRVFTQFHKTSGGNSYEMRSVIDHQFGYIWNPWSDGEKIFRNESQAGRTFKAMKAAAKNDSQIARRVDLFVHRTPHELYDYSADPDALSNLVDDKNLAKQRHELQQHLLNHMRKVNDPMTERFEAFLAQE